MGSSRAVDRSVVERLCSFARRGACTDAERRAAAALHDELRAAGHEAWVEARWTRPQADASLLVHAGLAVLASLLSVAAPLPAAIIAGVTALSLVIEASGRTGPLRMLFPRRATQHVLTVPDGAGVALVIAAPYDAPRRGVLRGARGRRLAARVPGRPLGWAAACAVVVAAACAARAAGVEDAWLGAIQLVPTLVLLGVVAAAVDGMAAEWSDGVDEAAGVAVALALHDELSRNPPASLAPGLLLHGAGAPGPQALRAHLKGERLGARETVVLAVGPSGTGAPVWATRHSQVRAAARRAAGALGVPEHRGLRPPAGTGRLPALAVAASERSGEADRAAMEAVLDLALAVVDALDADLGARRSA
jgi:hypothetical protein